MVSKNIHIYCDVYSLLPVCSVYRHENFHCSHCLERYLIALSFAPKMESGILEDLMRRPFKGQPTLAETATYTGFFNKNSIFNIFIIFFIQLM